VSVLSRICVGLGAFLLVAGAIYGFTSHEPAGITLLLVASVTFWFLALVARHVAKQEAERPGQEEDELHIGPTIWPFGFAISAVLIGLGLIVSPWILIPGAVAFVLCAAGWIRDVARSHGPAEHGTG
jgi:Cytochrome c oxidase subunit IV